MKTLKLISIFSITILIALAHDTNAQGLKGDKDKKESKEKNKSFTSSGSEDSYTTAIGLRGGFTSGLTIKHFIKSNAALEGILGTRWHGFNIAGLYELHKGNAFDVPELTWEYGGGLRIGSYPGRWYYSDCDDPLDPDCNGYYSSSVIVIGLVGIGGLEYKFKEVPFTVSLDLMPYFDFVGWDGGFIDGSLSVRYIIK